MSESLKNKLLRSAAIPLVSAMITSGAAGYTFAAESQSETAAAESQSEAAAESQSEAAAESQSEAADAGAAAAAAQTEAQADISDKKGIAAEDWLPIGSIVAIKGYDRSFMVLGRAIRKQEDGKYYDYCACLYPDGYMGGDLYFFNEDAIEEVVFEGFEDEYEQLLRLQDLDGLNVDSLSSEETEQETQPESGTAAETDAPESETQVQTEKTTEKAEPQTEAKPAEPETQKETQAETQAEARQTAEAASSEKAVEEKTYTVTDNVRLRSKPSTDSDSLITIPGNRQVRSDSSRKEKDGWMPVIFTDSSGKELSGWVKKEFLQ